MIDLANYPMLPSLSHTTSEAVVMAEINAGFFGVCCRIADAI